MAENETVDPSLLRDRGWTCSKLKARENQEIKNKQHACKGFLKLVRRPLKAV